MPARMLTRLDLCDAAEMYKFATSVSQRLTAKAWKLKVARVEERSASFHTNRLFEANLLLSADNVTKCAR
jgi:hypothetical protein